MNQKVIPILIPILILILIHIHILILILFIVTPTSLLLKCCKDFFSFVATALTNQSNNCLLFYFFRLHTLIHCPT